MSTISAVVCEYNINMVTSSSRKESLELSSLASGFGVLVFYFFVLFCLGLLSVLCLPLFFVFSLAFSAFSCSVFLFPVLCFSASVCEGLAISCCLLPCLLECWGYVVSLCTSGRLYDLYFSCNVFYKARIFCPTSPAPCWASSWYLNLSTVAVPPTISLRICQCSIDLAHVRFAASSVLECPVLQCRNLCRFAELCGCL